MAYEIIISPEAGEDIHRLAACDRARVRDALEIHLRHEPTKVSKSRIKRLRGMIRPQFRLRVDELRIFYDVTGEQIDIIAVVPKSRTDAWLTEHGIPIQDEETTNEDDSADGSADRPA